jgi:hypothetical protein
MHLATILPKMLAGEKFEDAANYTARRIHSQGLAVSLEEADVLLRNSLFEHYKKEGEYSSAANALAGIAVENSARWASDTNPEARATAAAEHYVKVTRRQSARAAATKFPAAASGKGQKKRAIKCPTRPSDR